MTTPGMWEHQRVAVKEMLKRGLLLYFDMGTGKTRTYVEYTEQEVGIHLVICPKSMLHTWKREFLKWRATTPKNTFIIHEQKLDSVRKLVKKILEKNPTELILITNHHTILNLEVVKTLARIPKITSICIDESQRFAEPKNTWTKHVFALKKQAEVGKVFCLSGTPIKNTEADLWSQIKLVESDGIINFRDSFWAFKSEYFTEVGVYGGKLLLKKDATTRFKGIVNANAMRVKKELVLELPPLLKTSVEVDMPTNMAIHYNELADEMCTYIEQTGETVVVENMLVQILRFLQICSDVMPKSNQCFIATPKEEALISLLDSRPKGAGTIVWCNFIPAIDKLVAICKKLGFSVGTIQGGQSVKDREAVIDGFMNKDIDIVVANQQAGGVGINLTRADCMIYYSRGYSYEQDSQSEARCYRAGSEEHTTVLRYDLLYKQTIEEAVFKALSRKASLSEMIQGIEWTKI